MIPWPDSDAILYQYCIFCSTGRDTVFRLCVSRISYIQLQDSEAARRCPRQYENRWWCLVAIVGSTACLDRLLHDFCSNIKAALSGQWQRLWGLAPASPSAHGRPHPARAAHPSVQERGQAAVHTTLDLLSRYRVHSAPCVRGGVVQTHVHEMNNLVKSDG